MYRINVPTQHVEVAKSLLTAAEQKDAIKGAEGLTVRFAKEADASAFTWLMRDATNALLAVTED